MRIPKHYRLVKEHPHSFEIHDTRDKNTFHIAKDHIDEKMHAKIASTPKYAEGGKVEDMPLIGKWIWENDKPKEEATTLRTDPYNDPSGVINQYERYPLPPYPDQWKGRSYPVDLPQEEIQKGYKGPVMAAEGGEIPETDNDADTGLGDEDMAKKYGNMTAQERMEALMRYTQPKFSEESNALETYPATEEVAPEVPRPPEAGFWTPPMQWHTPISDQGPEASRGPAGEVSPEMLGKMNLPGLGKMAPPPDTGAVPVVPKNVLESGTVPAKYVPPGGESNIAPTGRTKLQAPLHTPTLPEAMVERAGMMQGPYGEMERLIKGGVTAEQKFAEQANKAWEDYSKDISTRPNVADMAKTLVDKGNAAAELMIKQQINPNRYWQNTGALGKASSAIGLIFGGIGAAMTKGPNYAMEVINKAIDRDIEAQKSTQETTKNLWNINKDILGNRMQAELQTRQQLLSNVEAQIKGYAALAGGPIAAAKAAPALLEIQKSKQDLAMMQAITSGAAPGSEAGHQGMMNYMQMKNPEIYKDMQSKYLPNKGSTKIPLTNDDREAFGGYDSLQKTLQEAQNFATIERGTIPLTEAQARAKVIRSALILEANKLFKINRLNEQELGLFETMSPDPGSWWTGNTLAKLGEMQRQVDAHRKVDQIRVGYMPFPETSAKEKALVWARQRINSADPKEKAVAAELLQRLGQ